MPNVMKALGQTSATAAAATEFLNLVKDPSFETMTYNATPATNVWTSLTGSLWNIYTNAGANASATTGSLYGSFALSHTLSGSWTTVYLAYGSQNQSGLNTSTAMPVTAGTTYYYGTSFYTNNKGAWQDHNMRIQWYNASGVFLSESSTNVSSSVDTWVRTTGSAVAPANAAWASIVFYQLAALATIRYDGIHFSPVASTNTTYPTGIGTNLTLNSPFTSRLQNALTGAVAASTTVNTYAGAPVAIYTVPAGKQAVVSTLQVANLSTSAQTYRIAHVPSGETLAKKHWIAFDIPIAASSTDPWTTGIAMNSGDILYVASDSADVSFTAHGTEITP